MTLDDLAIHYDTDKSSRHHNYVKYYDRYFAPLRERALRVLEIGVKDGGSVRTWRDYFPLAEIHGIDCRQSCLEASGERIHIHVGSQQDPEFLAAVCEAAGGEFDIIIDDGSHVNEFTLASFETLFERLKPGGIYVIEDLTCSYDTSARFENKREDMREFFTTLIESIDIGGRRDVFRAVRHSQDFAKIPDDLRATLSVYERWIESIHFYQSICFILKRPADI